MTDHHMETYERKDGKRGWRITVGDDIVATDGGQGYENEKDCLAGMFGNFFGQYDESFLTLYAKWQEYAGQEYDIPPEAQAGAPVAVRTAELSGGGESAPEGYPEEHMAQDEALIDEYMGRKIQDNPQA